MSDSQTLIEVFDRTDADDPVRSKTGEATPRDWSGEQVLRIPDSLKRVIATINGAAVGVVATTTLPMDVCITSTAPVSASWSPEGPRASRTGRRGRAWTERATKGARGEE